MLNDALIRSLRSQNVDYKKSDQKGLYLLIKKNGSKYWRFQYRFGGKQKQIACGVYPDVSLAEARQQREEARKLIRSNIDPIIHKNALKDDQKESNANSFKVIALEWFSQRGLKSESSEKRVKRLFERDLFPYLATRPIKEITTQELLRVLRIIESRGTIETAHRAKQYTSHIFLYAISTCRADQDITANLKRALKTPTKKHFAAITDPKKLGHLLKAIDAYEATPTVKCALQLSPLLLCRPGELRHLQWNEVNWEEERIEIPAEKMKMKQPHIIPLCTQALDILKRLRPITERSIYLFPSIRSDKQPMSENTIRVALRTMGFTNDEMTAHGFRATARTLLDEVLGVRPDYIEHQLAHAVRDPNGRAYNRTAHLDERRKMMQKWADYLDGLRNSV